MPFNPKLMAFQVFLSLQGNSEKTTDRRPTLGTGHKQRLQIPSPSKKEEIIYRRKEIGMKRYPWVFVVEKKEGKGHFGAKAI